MEPKVELENSTLLQQAVVRRKTTQWILRAMAPQKSGQKAWRRGIAGQSLVEFALSLPFLMALLLGLLEVGLLIRSHLTIIYATREGARSEAAAGPTDVLYWPIQNAAAFYTMSDGDTVMVNNVNAALQSERSNVLFLSTYKADSTYGDPCQPKFSGSATTNSNGTCSFTSSTLSNTNFTNWPVARYNPNNNFGSSAPLIQEIFQGAGAPNYGFTRLLMDGTQGSDACPSQPPYYGFCGSNSNRDNSSSSTIKLNPWYPAFRCDLDPSSPSTGQTGAAVNGGNSTYYNTDANANGFPASRDWIGVRIDYKHPWLTGFFTGPLVLTDRSVYNLEPISLTGSNLTDCSKSS